MTNITCALYGPVTAKSAICAAKYKSNLLVCASMELHTSPNTTIVQNSVTETPLSQRICESVLSTFG